jgi:tRNA modification GTPase
MNQMRGAFGRELSALRSQLLQFVSLIELELDFADHEELEFADRTELKALAAEIATKLASLIASFLIQPLCGADQVGAINKVLDQ